MTLFQQRNLMQDDAYQMIFGGSVIFLDHLKCCLSMKIDHKNILSD